MGKKKFIDKKKSATFHLLACDTSDSTASFFGGHENDRVFVRVDNNNFQCPGFLNDDNNHGHSDLNEESDSIFADAVVDHDDNVGFGSCLQPPWAGTATSSSSKKGMLPDNVRKEILELGLPDDGYNYLIHLREIKNAGGGSSYFENSKAKLDRLTLDVKAYDASRLQINSEVTDGKDIMYAVASNTRSVKVQKVVDPDVLRLLDDSDLSQFGSDDEGFEEDFVVKANLPEVEQEQIKRVHKEREEIKAGAAQEDVSVGDVCLDLQEQVDGTVIVEGNINDNFICDEKPRVRRFLDEQFDLLTLREYDNDSDDDDDVPYDDAEREMLNSKLRDALKEFALDELEVEGKYRVAGDKKNDHQENIGGTEVDDPEVIRRCVEYAEKYLNESQDEEEVFVEESSDESEGWDCETIVSTYSNLDNHPGRIQAPENLNKKFPRIFPRDLTTKSNVITLRGKEKLPVNYLPNKVKTADKVKLPASLINDKPKRRSRSEESKDEKKERKAALKEERRESRRAKKELKGLYKCEGQRAQRVAAISGPSSIHIM